MLRRRAGAGEAREPLVAERPKARDLLVGLGQPTPYPRVLGEPATPAVKHASAPRPITKSTKHLAARAAHQSARTAAARARRSIRHGGSEPVSGEERAQIGLSERINTHTVAIIAGGLGSTELAAAQDLAAVLDDGDNLRVLPVVP